MKNREIDDLFRKKLETFRAEPSAEAWKKVDAGIRPKRESWRFYLGIAASLLVLFVISMILIYPRNEAEQTLASNQNIVESSDETINNDTVNEQFDVYDSIEEEVPGIPEDVVDESQDEVPTNRDTAPDNSLVRLLAAADEKTEETRVQEEKATENSDQPVFDLNLGKVEGISSVDKITDENAIALNAQTYKLEVPTEEEETDRGLNLKKVVDIARDLKNNTNGWGALREAKNEFLSLGRKRNEDSQED